VNNQPRSLNWFNYNGHIWPQIIFEPRVGSLDIKPMVDPRVINHSEFHLTLDELAAKYPAPATQGVL
jgi:hypothetical protein